MSKELYVDCEWFITQEIYLIGYAYDLRSYGQLYEQSLTKRGFLSLLEGVDRIYFWGPDIGMMEKFFGIDLRSRYHCINLLTAMKRIEPKRRSYKLAHFEKLAGVKRTTSEYKQNIFTLHKDWRSPIRRSRALLYNREDVLNMVRVKRFFFTKHRVTKRNSLDWKLK